MKSFKNKLVVITGAASGIGLALARAFAAEGAKLILCDNHPKNLEKTASELQDYLIKSYCFDVGREESFLAIAKEVDSLYGGADLMINNAGVALGKMSAEETSTEEFKWLMDVNFWGMVYGSEFFLPQLKAKREAALVNLSSLFGLIGTKYQSAYCASKFGIRGFTEALMAENQDSKLQIHLVHPGGINTNISLNARGGDPSYNKIFHDKFLTKNSPEKAARVILKGIKSNKKRIKIGSEAEAGDLAARIFPVSLINFVQKHFHKDLD
ncbi:MAG: SDR family NAD(P)-dependent oxidoreductase [Bacteroidetes bacterium]|nr:SDR family NAD(P)-dependent oxidoreductase [Bacteroidota bacterium]